jgi:hypothetical protein
MKRIITMSRLGFWMPTSALGLAFASGVSMAHAQQAGAVDPTTFNLQTGNQTRPTLVLPEHVPPQVAANTAAHGSDGWSPAGGPYISADGRVLATNQLPGDTPRTKVAGR